MLYPTLLHLQFERNKVLIVLTVIYDLPYLSFAQFAEQHVEMAYKGLSFPILVLWCDITSWGVANLTIYCKSTCYVRSRHHVLRLNQRPTGHKRSWWRRVKCRRRYLDQ